MHQDREVGLLMPQRCDSTDRETRRVFHPASGRDLDPVRSQRSVVPCDRKRCGVDHRSSSSGIHRQTQHDASGWTIQLSLNDNEAPIRIERISHRTTAVPSGIPPV